MVSWVFLILALWGALWTLVSFRPPHRPGFLMVIGFFAAWSTTELAPIHLLCQLAVVIVFVLLGALDSWPGWVGLAITLVSWVGLASSVKGALETDRAFADAMADALGPEWNANLDPQLRASAAHVNWARIVFPFWFRRRGVERLRNIQYVDDGRKRHRLDVYRRVDARDDAPVLLQIHGGGWMIGNKDQQGLPLMYHLAARGWVCVAINYRLSPRGTWPEHLVDCKRALAWIRTHIAEYGGDPGYVVVTGGSAGGHLTALMGLTANDPQYQPGFEDADTSVRAMIPFYGVYDWTGTAAQRRDEGLRDILQKHIVKRPFDEARDVYECASPLLRVHPGAPPALVVHGDLDTLAPVEEARAFVQKLRATSHKPVVYVELKGAHHAFEVFNSIRAMHVIAGVDLYLAWLLRAEPPCPAPARPAVDRTDSAGPAAPASDPTPTAYTAPRPARPTRATPGRS
jgi:acetyl esterase/lipase